MEIIYLYFKLVIEPLENEIKIVKRRLNNKKISLTRDIDIKYLEKLEKLLFTYYDKLKIITSVKMDNN